MAKGQKEAVIEQVLLQVPTFRKHIDNAIIVLSSLQLELIKAEIGHQILTGQIEYSKDAGAAAEVRSYARSMVMNHLKKAKELNGGHSYVSGTTVTSNSNSTPRTLRGKEKVAPKGVNPDLLPDDLREFVKTLV